MRSLPAAQKKVTILAARALEIKAQKNQIQTNIETVRLNRLEQKLIERTEKVVNNVKQRLTATVATQTESPRAAPTKTVKVQVQVNLEKKKGAQWLEHRLRQLERRENFLLQGRLSVLTLISVSTFHIKYNLCYRSST